MVYENEDIKTIRVKKKTHDKLTKLCLKQESYDDLLNRLMFEEKEKPSHKKARYEDVI